MFLFYRFSLNQLPQLKVFNLICEYICLMTNFVMILWVITLVRKTMTNINIVVSHILKNVFLINYFEHVNLFN